MRFQFSIDQLLNVKESYKSLSSIEGRALVYQRVLLTEEPKLKLELMKILKADETKHQYSGPVAAKYLETLQRSNEQLVKLASLISKNYQ